VKPTVYLAGPMRGYPEFNFPAFHKAAADLRRMGFTVISPAEMDLAAGIDPKTVTVTQEMLRDFAARDLTAVINLRPECGDGVAVLAGWKQSRGAQAEVMTARWMGLMLYNAETGKPISASCAWATEDQ
jgi:hypothetical protein